MRIFDVFRAPTLRERLARQLDEAVANRVHSTAKVNYWNAMEQFQRTEITRLNDELTGLAAGDAEAESTASVAPLAGLELRAASHSH